jgi:hygromycin-B 7''-O-kinase
LRGDPAVWLPAIRVIAERHGLGTDSLYAERTGTNVVFSAGDSAWIKLIVPLWREDFDREQCALAALRDSGVPVPPLLADGTLEGWPYLVMGCVPGRNIATVWSDLDRRTQIALATELGTIIARLHAVDTTGLTALEHDWSAFMRQQRDRCLAKHAEAGASEAWQAEIARYVQSVPVLDEPGSLPVLLHADLTDEHLMVAQQGGAWRVTGIIDWADAMLGQPLYEFSAPLVFLTQRQPWAQRAILRGYGFSDAELTPDLARRLTAYALLHRFGRLADFLRLCPAPRPTSMAELERALIDL